MTSQKRICEVKSCNAEATSRNTLTSRTPRVCEFHRKYSWKQSRCEVCGKWITTGAKTCQKHYRKRGVSAATEWHEMEIEYTKALTSKNPIIRRIAEERLPYIRLQAALNSSYGLVCKNKSSYLPAKAKA